MWFLSLTFLAEKDRLLFLEMEKYLEMSSKFRNIETNHIILLNILLDSYCMLFDIVRLVNGVCHLLSIYWLSVTRYLILVI